MSQRIRGQEVSLQVAVDGVLQTGSFAKIESFTLTPRTDITESDFLGERQSDLDIQHHGWDFGFECHEQDSKVMALLMDIIAREEQGSAHPKINLIAIKKYRSPEEPSQTLVLMDCYLKVDSHGFGGRKDYVKTSFSGKCKVVKKK